MAIFFIEESLLTHFVPMFPFISMLSSIPRPNISYLLISTRTFVYQGVKNVKLQNTGKHLNKKHMHKMGSELECHRN